MAELARRDAFVLKYRLGPKYHHPVELGDAQRAIRTVRSKAGEYRLCPIESGSWDSRQAATWPPPPGRISTRATAGRRPHRQAQQPPGLPGALLPGDLVYRLTHSGFEAKSARRQTPTPNWWRTCRTRSQVTAQTPPTFLFHTTTDHTVPVENSVMFYSALRKAGVPAELHIYERGPHGVGLAQTDEALSSWPARLADWLRVRGLLNSACRDPVDGM